jgi:hypothetical protein
VPSISPAPPSTNVIDGSEGFFRGLVYRKRTGEIFTIQLNALVMDFALPASLFVATASTPRNEMLAQGPLLEILGAVSHHRHALPPVRRVDARRSGEHHERGGLTIW